MENFIGKYVVCRFKNAGVHAGILKAKEGQTVHLQNSRRLWYWDGAASLSELAMFGVSKPENCKFPCVVNDEIIEEEIEIIPCTEIAQKSISEVPEWKMRK
ncbi:MAG TPA: hypothetical protein VKO45_01185 [Methanomicrobiales archaeon]|nr:hypothetical protein [Methanomicrobiales archaeon]